MHRTYMQATTTADSRPAPCMRRHACPAVGRGLVYIGAGVVKHMAFRVGKQSCLDEKLFLHALLESLAQQMLSEVEVRVAGRDAPLYRHGGRPVPVLEVSDSLPYHLRQGQVSFCAWGERGGKMNLSHTHARTRGERMGTPDPWLGEGSRPSDICLASPRPDSNLFGT